jgi:peptide/nickel transport system permease protein
MAQANPPIESGTTTPKEKSAKGTSTFTRVARYTGVRVLTMAFTVTIGVYLTILIANMGGYVDQIRRAQIREDVNMRIANSPATRNLAPEEKQKLVESTIAAQEKRYGMDKPFITRSFNFLWDGLSLNLGRALQMSSNTGSNQVRLIILERLPPTLLLFGTADLLLFFSALFFALILSRQYGSFFDKLLIGLTPLSSAPAWFYGIFLILLFAAALKILPFGGMVEAPPPSNPFAYLLSLLKHMILPVLALTLSQSFLSIFTWRTFFLIYSSEDYVDMAKAKGLTSREIERKYILRPTLPTIITSFALLVIGSWLGAPVLETIFSWQGLGRLLFVAVGFFDVPVIVGETVIFSYLLAITVFLLDFIYALVDPRVKIGGGESKA